MLNSIEEHITILIYRPTYIFFTSSGLLRPDILVRPLQGFLVHCGLVHCRLKLFFLRISFSDLKVDVSSCVGRLERVLLACLEKVGCRQYRPSPLCTSCIYRLLACMAVLFQESSTLLYGLCCFLLVSECVNLAI